MALPLVSIIIPVFNRISWLRECIDSVLEQTYTNLEIIIVDDASNPPVASMIAISDPRLRIIRHQQNKGPGASRETGRQAARGEYIDYLDSDDVLHPQKIEEQVDILTKNPDIDMCYCTTAVFEDLPFLDISPIWHISNMKFSEILPVILYQRPWATCSCLWTRTASDIIGPWSSLRVGEDIEYETRAGCKGIKITHLADTMAFVRRNNEELQLSNLSNQRLIEATHYILKNVDNLLQSPKKGIRSVRTRMVQILFNQAIFLLTQKEKEKAQICLESIHPFLENDLKLRMIKTYKILTTRLPVKVSVLIGRFLRPRIFHNYINENAFPEFLEEYAENETH